MAKDSIVDNLLNKYSLELNDKKYLKRIIIPIINHDEFRKRLTKKFLHHGNITLGEHIIEDAILTYKLSQKKKITYKEYRIDLAVKIAMFHDLYTIPYQNNKEAHVNHFFHKHGFRHPVEAVINAINWYPNYFSNLDDAKIIIDGILHHMYPLPVMRIDYNNIEYYELRNLNSYQKLKKHEQNLILESLNRRIIGPVSISKSRFIEGKIMAKADKKVSRKQIKNFQSMKALLTGKNKNIYKNDN